MCNLSIEVKNTPKKMPKVWNIQAEIYIGNTIEYDVKEYQVKKDSVKCTRVQLKVLKLNCS